MADVKISALPASTTPLAGTEVLPIVQSATTRQVSVANLTAGRAVSALSIATTTGATFATTSGSVGIGTASPSYTLDLSSTTNGIIARFKSTSTYGQVVADNTSGTGGGLFIASQNGVASSYFGVEGAILGTSSQNTGIYNNVAGTSINFYNSGSATAKLTIDSSGILSVGVTPSPWGSGFKAIEIGYIGCGINATSNNQTNVVGNAYGNSGWKYSATGVASSLYQQNGSGSHAWSYAAAGTAGNAITWIEAMQINTSGSLLVGTTSYAGVQIGVGYAGNVNTGIGINDTTSTSGCGFALFQIGGTTIGSISRVSATSAVVYNTTSDQRLKSNVTNSESVINKLMQVQVRQYDWTEGAVHQDYGFIAQELESVLSGIVTKGKTEEDMWQLDYSKITPHLVKAIQEQQALIESLTIRLTALENK